MVRMGKATAKARTARQSTVKVYTVNTVSEAITNHSAKVYTVKEAIKSHQSHSYEKMDRPSVAYTTHPTTFHTQYTRPVRVPLKKHSLVMASGASINSFYREFHARWDA